VLFGCRFFRERPGQHELGLEHRAAGINQTIQRNPFVDGMVDPQLSLAAVWLFLKFNIQHGRPRLFRSFLAWLQEKRID
jgi:hypothetical protein